MPRISLLFQALLTAALGCAPATSSPQLMMAMLQTQTGSLQPGQVKITSLQDVVALRGTVARMLADARIVVDSNDPLLATGPITDQQLAKILVKSSGGEPHAGYDTSGGVLWPTDFHTWNMVSIYYNFEQAHAYFVARGIPSAELDGALIYYFPSFVSTALSSDPLSDNAYYFSPIQGFVILPFKLLQTLPIAMNLGAMAHEYSHRVFNTRAYQGQSTPAPLATWIDIGGAGPQVNLLKSLDEGLADYHGVGTTCLTTFGCNPQFIAQSLTKDISDSRDVSTLHCITAGLQTDIISLSVKDFTQLGKQYDIGALISSSLWQAGEKTGQREPLQRYVLQSYADPGLTPGFKELFQNNLTTPGNVTLAALLNVLISHITSTDLQIAVCNQFIDRLKVSRTDMPACPASAGGGTSCQ